jgi:hypothetical protein
MPAGYGDGHHSFTFDISGEGVFRFDDVLIVQNPHLVCWPFATPFKPTAAAAHPRQHGEAGHK